MSSACDSCPSSSSCTSKNTGSCPSQGPAKEPLAEGSSIKKVIGIASGKGGVGKSFVTSVLASELTRKGLKVGILDADVTGPSIPNAFGLGGMLESLDGKLIIPAVTKTGIKTVSINLVLQDKEAPVIWRGPVLNSLVKQFWGQANWETLDVLLIDMPPGTGDVPLTVFQSVPVDGIILVSTAQDLVSMIVNKARNMATMMNVPVLGLIENMSYVKCPHCGERINLYGSGENVERSAAQIGSRVLGKLALDPGITKLVDSGKTEDIEEELLGDASAFIADMLK